MQSTYLVCHGAPEKHFDRTILTILMCESNSAEVWFTSEYFVGSDIPLQRKKDSSSHSHSNLKFQFASSAQNITGKEAHNPLNPHSLMVH